MFGSFFVMNLVLAAIKSSVSAKASHKDEHEAEFAFRRSKSLKNVKLRTKKIDLRVRMHSFVESDGFNRFWMVLIIVNTLVLACEHYGMSALLETILCKK